MSRVSSIALSFICALILGGASASLAAPITIFSENFDRYSSFPSEIPIGDKVNAGIPEISEGADKFWYAARFRAGDGTIDSDLAVQKTGGPGDMTPVGRVEDKVALIFKIDTESFTNVNLQFDWRTYQGQSGHFFVAGYHVGDDLGLDTTTNRYKDLLWTSFTEVVRKSPTDTFTHESVTLPSGVKSLYVALWYDDGEKHYGKVDNISVTGTSAIPLIIPEPSMLGSLGLLVLSLARGRRA
ncbi:MAG TPA: hypothetical protein VHD56_18410 [Tepidisphaeraceae bacterium]|nr:hypothetical protein [Tepidisphaeraceae bacterium]